MRLDARIIYYYPCTYIGGHQLIDKMVTICHQLASYFLILAIYTILINVHACMTLLLDLSIRFMTLLEGFDTDLDVNLMYTIS